MNTTKKCYRDEEEIELAWKELIQAIKPVKITTSPASHPSAFNTSGISRGKSSTINHPAIITNGELGQWEIFG